MVYGHEFCRSFEIRGVRSQPLRLRGQPLIEEVVIRFVFVRLNPYLLDKLIEVCGGGAYDLAPIAVEENRVPHLIR